MQVRSGFGAMVSALVLFFATSLDARSAVIVNFSGGNGAPLVMQIPSTIEFTVYQSAPVSPIFVLKGAGQFSNGTVFVGSGLSYSINGGPTIPITYLSSGASGGMVSVDDAFFYGNLAGVTNGDMVTLNAGIFTTTGNVTGPAPLGNSFTAFIVGDAQVDQVSTNGVAVPEPSATLLMGAGMAGAIFVRRRRGV